MYFSNKLEKLELKKHVAAVHCSNSITLLERKIANALLYHAYPSLLTQSSYEIHIPYLARLIGYNSKNTKFLKKALVKLISIVIEWNVIRDVIGKEKEFIWNATSFISAASIKGAWCAYSYSKEMRELLYQPEIYAKLDMNILSKFKSAYGLALYETCVRYKNVKKTGKISLSTFRKLMGVEEGKYIIFRDLKKRVIDKAIKEINAYSNLRVQVEIEKTDRARQVKTLQFYIEPACVVAKKLSKEIPLNKQPDDLTGVLKNDFLISDQKAKEIKNAFKNDFILQKIKIIKSSSSFKSGKIKNLAAYLINALQQDYQPSRSSLFLLSKQKQEKEKKQAWQKDNNLKKEKYIHYQNKIILNRYNELPHEEKEALIKQFGNFIKSTMYYNYFQKMGLDDPVLQERMCAFARFSKKTLLNGKLLENILSFKEFIKRPILEVNN